MDRLLKAINFAAIKHEHQRRKNKTASPYINHPIDVSNLLSQAGITDVEILMAAVLHDTVEDTRTTYEELIHEFGPRVANIVRECSDDKSLPKESRKQLQIEHAAVASTEAKLVKLGDKYSNLRDLLQNPPQTWSSDEISGYAHWCYAVYLKLQGTNAILEDKLNQLFNQFGVSGIQENKLDELLNKYYANIKNSE
jgi:(p)ppGpp synthase/HD superfamily hydrolase